MCNFNLKNWLHSVCFQVPIFVCDPAVLCSSFAILPNKGEETADVISSLKSTASVNKHESVGFEVPTALIMESPICWDVAPCSLLKGHQRSKQKGTCFMLVSCLAFSSTLMMEAICSFETSVDYQRATQRCVPEGGTLLHILTARCHKTLLPLQQ
jgi:hypothetical protein